LQQMPADIVERCQAEGLYWHYMSLYAEEVEMAAARDTEREAIAMFKAIEQGRIAPGTLTVADTAETTSGHGNASQLQSLWTFPRPDSTDHLW
ncbi:MAG: hypothetical protein AB4042_12170, partial [Leptolyngbyaceae cyanobacterium]